MSAELVESLVPAVVDASMVIKWLLDEPGSGAARTQRHAWDAHGIVPAAPDFLLIELHSILLKKLARREIALDLPWLSQTPTFGIDLSWFPFEPLLPLAWRLALHHQISIDDALYAALAQSLGVALYTADTRLAERLTGSLNVKTLALT